MCFKKMINLTIPIPSLKLIFRTLTFGGDILVKGKLATSNFQVMTETTPNQTAHPPSANAPAIYGIDIANDLSSQSLTTNDPEK